jgi:hypothetical protein
MRVLLKELARACVVRLQSMQIVVSFLWYQKGQADLDPELVPSFSGPRRIFEQSLIFGAHHGYNGYSGRMLAHGLLLR